MNLDSLKAFASKIPTYTCLFGFTNTPKDVLPEAKTKRAVAKPFVSLYNNTVVPYTNSKKNWLPSMRAVPLNAIVAAGAFLVAGPVGSAIGVGVLNSPALALGAWKIMSVVFTSIAAFGHFFTKEGRLELHIRFVNSKIDNLQHKLDGLNKAEQQPSMTASIKKQLENAKKQKEDLEAQLEKLKNSSKPSLISTC